MVTSRLHNHAVFSNEMKQQQTGHVSLMSRATWINDFFKQQAMFASMKPHLHIVISKLRINE